MRTHTHAHSHTRKGQRKGQRKGSDSQEGNVWKYGNEAKGTRETLGVQRCLGQGTSAEKNCKLSAEPVQRSGCLNCYWQGCRGGVHILWNSYLSTGVLNAGYRGLRLHVLPCWVLVLYCLLFFYSPISLFWKKNVYIVPLHLWNF